MSKAEIFIWARRNTWRHTRRNLFNTESGLSAAAAERLRSISRRFEPRLNRWVSQYWDPHPARLRGAALYQRERAQPPFRWNPSPILAGNWQEKNSSRSW